MNGIFAYLVRERGVKGDIIISSLYSDYGIIYGSRVRERGPLGRQIETYFGGWHRAAHPFKFYVSSCFPFELH